MKSLLTLFLLSFLGIAQQVDLEKQAKGTLPITNGGTGATTASGARSSLGVPSTSDLTSHTSNTSNPHNVTAAQVGKDTAQWNALKVFGKEVDDSTCTSPGNTKVLKFSTTLDKWTCADDAIGESGSGEANTASNTGSSGVGLFKQKSGVDLEFYKIYSTNGHLTIALDGTNKVDLTINSDSAKTAGTLVSRDSNGDFAGRIIEGDYFLLNYGGYLRWKNSTGTGYVPVMTADENATYIKGNYFFVQNETTNFLSLVDSSVGASLHRGLQLNSAGVSTVPSCDASIRGSLWYVRSSAGTNDYLKTCSKNSSDAYSWRDIWPVSTTSVTIGSGEWLKWRNSGDTGTVNVMSADESSATILGNSQYFRNSAGTSTHLSLSGSGSGASFGRGVQMNSSGSSRPSCTESLKGTLWYSPKQNGVKDEVWMCLKDQNDVYMWRSVIPSDLYSPDFDDVVTPGGTLTAGVPATITLTPCSLGLSGTNVGHYRRISGGVGTDETVLVTGGTCTSGAPSGTITFTPAYNHSGSWTFRSATAGIQEAINSLDKMRGGTVRLPPGISTLWGGITVMSQGIKLIGSSGGWAQSPTLPPPFTGPDRINTTLYVPNAANIPSYVIKVLKGSFVAQDFEIDGNYLNQTAGSAHGIWLTADEKGHNYSRIRGVNIFRTTGCGIRVTAEGGWYQDVGWIDSVEIRDTGLENILIDSTPDWIVNNANVGGTGNYRSGIALSGASRITIIGGLIDYSDGPCLYIYNSNRTKVIGTELEGCGRDGILLEGTSPYTQVSNVYVHNASYKFSSGTYYSGLRTSVGGTYNDLQIVGSRFDNYAAIGNSQPYGMYLEGSGTGWTFVGNILSGNRVSEIHFAASVSNLVSTSNGSTNMEMKSYAYSSSNHNIPNSTTTALGFDLELFDPLSMHDTTTNSNRFVAKTSGVYLAFGQAMFDSGSTGSRTLYVRKNGVTASANRLTSPLYSNWNPVQVTAIVELAVGDYVDFAVNQDSGSTMVVYSGYNNTFGSVVKLW